MSQFEFTKILYLWFVIFVVAMNVDGIVIIIQLPLGHIAALPSELFIIIILIIILRLVGFLAAKL